ncbi:MAG: hemolysin-like protein [Kordiimonadales bacterium]|nr:MAG: hemolysin-like protein [Kordiimonadales bacterium]
MKKYAPLRPSVAAAQAMAGAPSYVRKGSIEVRLARSFQEIKIAQKLRYNIFYEEMQAKPTWKMKITKRDMDPYDVFCDHLLVIDHDKPKTKRIVGTYRLLRQEIAEAHEGFYSAGEFDLGPLMTDHFRKEMGEGKQLLELGRSCVHKEYRSNATINLLWQGIAEYLKEFNIAYMFGCASFDGTDPAELKEPLAYLYHNHLVAEDFKVTALSGMHEEMNLIAQDDIDVRKARRALPPLIKGYLRLGCLIGNGAVVDKQFGTTDVFILLPVERIAKRYSKHYDLKTEANDTAESTKAVQ